MSKVDSMGVRSLFLAWVLCTLASGSHGLQAGRPLPREDESKSKGEVKTKPGIKTITTKHGDIYDCVDFYKQPAFDHPLLKNHNFHHRMSPNFPQRKPRLEINRNMTMHGRSIIRPTGRRCPIGTVPIRRTTSDEINHNLTAANPGIHYALLRTKNIPNKKYNGGNAQLCLYRPVVTPNQYSSAQMKFQSGFDFIEVGWTVNPRLYKDAQTRLFILFHNGERQCVDTHCPGFVVVSNKVTLGMVLKPVSKRLSKMYYFTIQLLVQKDGSGWWFHYEDNPVGFWPANLFKGLSSHANRVEWGGEVGGPPSEPSAPMGSSYTVTKAITSDAFVSNISVIDESNNVVDPNAETYIDNKAYDAVDAGKGWDSIGRLLFFGGPGGVTGG